MQPISVHCVLMQLSLAFLPFLLLLDFVSVSVESSPLSSIGIPDVLEFESILTYRFINNEAARAPGGRNPVDCYLITQCSADRLPNLKRLALTWNGAISVGLYIRSGVADKVNNLNQIDQFVSDMQANKNFTGRIYMSILFGHEDKDWHSDDIVDANITEPLYPVNTLRNLAVATVPVPYSPRSSTGAVLRSPLLFLLDVDFRPSPGLGEWISDNFETLMRRCLEGQLFVVPAFELEQARYQSLANTTYGELDNKLDLESAVNLDVIEPFHFSKFPPGHGPTDFPRYFLV